MVIGSLLLHGILKITGEMLVYCEVPILQLTFSGFTDRDIMLSNEISVLNALLVVGLVVGRVTFENELSISSFLSVG